MNKNQVINVLEITEKQLDLLEYDYLKVHKEHVDKIIKSKEYPTWYLDALKEWKGKRTFIFGQSPPTL